MSTAIDAILVLVMSCETSQRETGSGEDLHHVLLIFSNSRTHSRLTPDQPWRRTPATDEESPLMEPHTRCPSMLALVRLKVA